MNAENDFSLGKGKEKWPYTARHANERVYPQRMKCYTVRMRYRALSTRQFWGKGRIRFQ